MSKYERIGNIGFIIGGILNVLRIFPILLTEGVTPEQIPPHTLADTVFISQTKAYLLSHVMALLATPFVIVGFYNLFKGINLSHNKVAVQTGIVALASLTIGQLLYSIGLIIDGFTLPELIKEFISKGGNESSDLATVIMAIHHLAMSFAGIGFFTLLLGTGVIGVALYNSSFNRALSFAPITIGVLAMIGYITGILDPMIANSFEFTYGLLTFTYIYYMIVGINQLRTLKRK